MLKAVFVSVVSRLIVLGCVLVAVNIYAGSRLFGKDGLLTQVETALMSLKEVSQALN